MTTFTEELAGRGISDEEINSLLATRIVVTESASHGVKIPLIAADGTMFLVGLELSADLADLERLAREVPEGGAVVLRPAVILDAPDATATR